MVLSDPAKEGPRLFSFEAVDPGFFDEPKWIEEKFRLTLWCEHSRLPLTHPERNGGDPQRGVYEINLTRDWIVKSAPYLKFMTGALSLALPVAAAGVPLTMPTVDYKAIENQLKFGRECAAASLKGSERLGDWLSSPDETELATGERRTRAADLILGADLRQFHELLKTSDPGRVFGNLVRVQNKRCEFLWVDEQFVELY